MGTAPGLIMKKDIRKDPMYIYLLLLTIGSTAGLQGWTTLFNNFAVENAHLDGFQVGVIQSVREIPGFLSLLVVYVLLIFREHRLAFISVFLCGAGVLATGYLPSFSGLLVTTTVMSLGYHYYETTNQSLTLQYFTQKQSPVVFAYLRSMTALTNVIIGALIWAASMFLEISSLFLISGTAVIIFSIAALRVDPVRDDLPSQHKKMIFRTRYWLYYLLNLLSGARRQIFIVFAILLLVERYRFTVTQITLLFLINNVINYFLSPYIGRAINRFGERKVLSLEYFSIIFIFLAYAFIDNALVAAGLYVLDQIFFNFAIGIRTYFQKIGDPADVAPSMAVGFTINHIAAVVLPAFGGALWLIDYRIPFIAGSVLGVCSLLTVQMMKETNSPLSPLSVD